jgi:flagellar hook-basal body complex protein FliE
MSAVSPIGAGAAGITPVTGVTGVSGTTSTDGTTGATGGAGSSFASVLGQGLQSLQSAQSTADNLSVQAATGTLTNAHDLMIATAQAQLATQLTVALRDKAVGAFNEIMGMQL